MTKESKNHMVEELESQFHSIHSKLVKAKDSYLSKHQKDYERARKTALKTRKKLDQARKKAAELAAQASKSGNRTAQNQLKKAKAAAVILGEAFREASEIMSTAEDKLKAVKPFEKKLTARAKALAAFEKEWQQKQLAAEKARQKRAAARRKTSKAKKPGKTKSVTGVTQ
jgi:hypothetical protein